MIARALVHEPKILILDEPTAGVDIEIRRRIWEFVKELNKGGRTIILTTHYLEEAENLCKNIAIIDHGTIIKNTSMKAFLRNVDTETYILSLAKPVKKQVSSHESCTIKMVDDTTLEVEISKKCSLNALFEHFQKNKIEIASIRRKSTRLEELFLELIDKGKNGS